MSCHRLYTIGWTLYSLNYRLDPLKAITLTAILTRHSQAYAAALCLCVLVHAHVCVRVGWGRNAC